MILEQHWCILELWLLQNTNRKPRDASQVHWSAWPYCRQKWPKQQWHRAASEAFTRWLHRWYTPIKLPLVRAYRLATRYLVHWKVSVILRRSVWHWHWRPTHVKGTVKSDCGCGKDEDGGWLFPVEVSASSIQNFDTVCWVMNVLPVKTWATYCFRSSALDGLYNHFLSVC